MATGIETWEEVSDSERYLQLITNLRYIGDIPQRSKLQISDLTYNSIDWTYSRVSHYFFGTTGKKSVDFIQKVLEEASYFSSSNEVRKELVKCKTGLRHLYETYNAEGNRLKICVALALCSDQIDTLLTKSKKT